ncbi:MFS transporter [Armatimonas sp.]|uniref:MFS transporter n=1 Tax=Armatimonas sp. TaxID=1872638 RepID=UPI003752BDE9
MNGQRRFLDMNGYQWTVLFAAWLGWGFDVFDGLLYALVADKAIPVLLHQTIGGPEAKASVPFWNGIMGSVLLIFWAIGGVLFGRITDKLGRTKTLLLTMLIYSVGTALCALAPNIWVLLLCRVFVAFGIGGEWAAGAAMVAEVVPEKRRVEAGALLYTSAPIGLLAADMMRYYIVGGLLKDSPETSWRWVFACGLLPALVAFLIRMFIKEPEKWQAATEGGKASPKISELFTPALRRATLGGMAMALVAMITWWSCNTFASVIASQMANAAAQVQKLDKPATQALVESWKSIALTSFCLGGLIGTLLTVPIAKLLGRRAMFAIYFLLGAASIIGTFAFPWPGEMRLYGYFPIGLTIFGVFGSFTYYLPELFPTRLRGTGAGFTYNIGRIIAAAGPFTVGLIAQQGMEAAFKALVIVGCVPIVGLCFLPFIVETKGRALETLDE